MLPAAPLPGDVSSGAAAEGGCHRDGERPGTGRDRGLCRCGGAPLPHRPPRPLRRWRREHTAGVGDLAPTASTWTAPRQESGTVQDDGDPQGAPARSSGTPAACGRAPRGETRTGAASAPACGGGWSIGIDCPESECGGTIDLTGSGGDVLAGVERLEYGLLRCTDGGDVRVQRDEAGGRCWERGCCARRAGRPGRRRGGRGGRLHRLIRTCYRSRAAPSGQITSTGTPRVRAASTASPVPPLPPAGFPSQTAKSRSIPPSTASLASA